MTITQATLDVTADDKTREYGDANPALTSTITGFKNGEDLGTSDVTGSANITTTSAPSDAVGVQVGIIDAAAGTLNSTNYAFNYVDGDMTITQATLDVTTDDKTREYGDANPALTSTITGFKNGEDLGTSDITGSASITTTSDPSDAVGVQVGIIDAAAGTLNSTNYAFNYVDGDMTITPAALTIDVDDKTKVYGDANPALTATYTGFKLGQDESVLAGNLATAATLASDVGNYAISSNQTNANYTVTVNDGNLSITPAVLTIQSNDTLKAYGDANPAFTSTFTGLKADDLQTDYTVNYTTIADANSNTGVYTITPGGVIDSNYNISFINGNLTITPAALTIDVDDKTKVYGDANPALTATYTGFKLGQDDSVLAGGLSTAAVLASDTGNYAITSNQTNANYTVTVNDGSLNVTPAALTIDVDDKTKVYGDANPALTATYTGFKLGQDESVLAGNLATTAVLASDVGNYAITSNQTNANYTVTVNDGNLSITPMADNIPPPVDNTPPPVVEVETPINTKTEQITNEPTKTQEIIAIEAEVEKDTALNINYESNKIETEVNIINDFTIETTTETDNNISIVSNNAEGAITLSANQIQSNSSTSLREIKQVIKSDEPIEKMDPSSFNTMFNICSNYQGNCSNVMSVDNLHLMEQTIFINSTEAELDADTKATNYIMASGYHSSGLKGYLETVAVIESLKKKARKTAQNIKTTNSNKKQRYSLSFNYRHPETIKRLEIIQDILNGNNETERKVIKKKEYNQQILNNVKLTPKVKKVLDIIHENNEKKNYFDAIDL